MESNQLSTHGFSLHKLLVKKVILVELDLFSWKVNQYYKNRNVNNIKCIFLILDLFIFSCIVHGLQFFIL